MAHYGQSVGARALIIDFALVFITGSWLDGVGTGRDGRRVGGGWTSPAVVDGIVYLTAAPLAVINRSLRTDTTIALVDFGRDALTLYYA
ncbi:hypothetical protein CSQ89_20050 [Chitinimonas sp. BJB300]|nr:hypothetical protein CSQ89_20050 [Chitinimonas sp. BJB300]